MEVPKPHLLWITVRRRIALIGSCTGLALALAVVYCVLAPRIYQATAVLLVEYNQDVLKKNAFDQPNGRFDDITTQMKVIASPVVIDRALNSLQPFQLGPSLANLSPEDRRLVLAKNLSVNNARGTRLLNLAYQSPNPATTTAIISAITDSYLQFTAETHRSHSQEILEILTRQKTDLEKQLMENDEQELKLQLAAGVILSEHDRTSNFEKRLSALEEELLKAQTARIRAAGLYRQVCAASDAKGSPDPFMLRLAGALGQQVVSEKMGVRSDNLRFYETTVEESLIKDEVELKRLGAIYGPDHPQVKALKERIERNRAHLKNPDAGHADAADKSGAQLTDLVRKMAAQELQEAQAIEQDLTQKIANEKAEAGNQNAKHLQLRALEAKGERLKTFYHILLQRIKELDMGENLAQIQVTVVGPPALAKKPVAPKVPMILLLSFLGGLGGGVGLSLLLDRLDNKFRSPEDIQQVLEAPLVGNVPAFETSLPCAPAMIMLQAPNAPEAEAFRTIRTWLLFRQDIRMFSVSSPLQGDGKSTIISNLAGAIAQIGKRTLLIDADLRRPSVHSAWSTEPSRGLAYLLLTGDCTPEAITQEIRPSPLPNLQVLPCGPIPANPGELLEKPELVSLLQWARTHYDYVLVDSPPLIPVADGRTIARLVDGLILVVRVQNDTREVSYRAKTYISAAGGTLLGVVGNCVDHWAHYGYYKYGKYGYGEKVEDTAPEEPDQQGEVSDAA